jgi:hypothetical protein
VVERGAGGGAGRLNQLTSREGGTFSVEAEFGIALLGDTNNDGVVNVADRSIANAFWRTGAGLVGGCCPGCFDKVIGMC